MGRLTEFLYGRIEELEQEEDLRARIDFRLKRDEKILIKQFAHIRGISVSDLIRTATLKYINDFIQIRD